MRLHPKDMKRFGSRLREIRKAKGFSQRQVADAWGCNPPNVSNIENGLTSVSVAQLIVFSLLVGRTPGQLITELVHEVTLSRYGSSLGLKIGPNGRAA